jgi:hypothetical protein
VSIADVIQEYAETPFEYGVDCCQFVAACIEDRTGENPMKAFEYSNEEEARAIIDKHGSLGNAMRKTLGEEIAVEDAQDGDVLLVDIRGSLPFMADIIGDEMAAVCFKGRAVVRTLAGVTDWPISRATAAWRV